MQALTDWNRRSRSLTMQSLTMRFTAAEVRRIQRAAKVCGWQSGESGSFAHNLLLRNVKAILTERRPAANR
jgi:hypothetical protein